MTLRTSLSGTGRTGAKFGLVGVQSAVDPEAVSIRLLKSVRHGARPDQGRKPHSPQPGRPSALGSYGVVLDRGSNAIEACAYGVFCELYVTTAVLFVSLAPVRGVVELFERTVAVI